MPLVTDVELASRSRDGDRGAFDLLVRCYLPSVYDLVARSLPEEGEAGAATLATFSKAVRSRRDLDTPEGFAAWLFAIAYDEVVSRLRARGRGGVADELGDTLEDQLDRRVWDAVTSLDPASRTALHLHTRHRLSPAEVARIVGVDAERADRFVARVVDGFRGALGEGAASDVDALHAYARLGSVEVPAGVEDWVSAEVARTWDATAGPELAPPAAGRRWRRAAVAAAVLTVTGVAAALAAPRLAPRPDVSDGAGAAALETTTMVPSPAVSASLSSATGSRPATAWDEHAEGWRPEAADPAEQVDPTGTPGEPASATTEEPPTGTRTGDGSSPTPVAPDALTVEIVFPDDDPVALAQERYDGSWAAYVEAAAEAHDPEGQRVVGRWFSDQQEHDLGRTGRINFWLELPEGCPGDPVVHTVTIEVTDPDDNVATDSVEIEVRCPRR